MTVRNKSTLGLPQFLKEFYQDCKAERATGWWNERFGRRAERVSVVHNDTTLNNVYDLVNYIKDNVESISDEEIKYFADETYRAFPALALKRAYFWEVDDAVQEKEIGSGQEQEEEVALTQSVEETPSEDESPKEEKPVPDFEFAKTIEDRKELKDYAKEFGFKLDSRKSLPDMMKSFQGKFHASKGK